MATCNRLGIAGKSSYTQRAFRRLRKKYGVELQQGDLSNVFTTVGDADTLWHLQFFNAVTLKSHRLIEEERSSRHDAKLLKPRTSPRPLVSSTALLWDTCPPSSPSWVLTLRSLLLTSVWHVWCGIGSLGPAWRPTTSTHEGASCVLLWRQLRQHVIGSQQVAFQ